MIQARAGRILDGETIREALEAAAVVPASWPDDPSDDVIREIDRAIHHDWPNARKMAIAVYHATILALQGKGAASA